MLCIKKVEFKVLLFFSIYFFRTIIMHTVVKIRYGRLKVIRFKLGKIVILILMRKCNFR